MAEPKNLLSREQKIREKNILNRAGKALIFNEPKILELMLNRKVPTQMQHCIIKVQQKMAGTDKEAFVSAFNICQAVFQNHGYQYPDSTTLTSKGLQNNMRHRREVGNSMKEARFRQMTSWFKNEMVEAERQKNESLRTKENEAAMKKAEANRVSEIQKKLDSGQKITQKERESLVRAKTDELKNINNKIVARKTTKKP